MSDILKCPFCQQELQEDVGYDGDYSCPNCKEPYFGSPELWQELIKLMENKDLSDKIGKLETELERTRKALEIAVDALKLMYQGNGDPQDIMRYIDNRWTPVRRLCKQTLEQITALEQKDK